MSSTQAKQRYVLEQMQDQVASAQAGFKMIEENFKDLKRDFSVAVKDTQDQNHESQNMMISIRQELGLNQAEFALKIEELQTKVKQIDDVQMNLYAETEVREIQMDQQRDFYLKRQQEFILRFDKMEKKSLTKLANCERELSLIKTTVNV